MPRPKLSHTKRSRSVTLKASTIMLLTGLGDGNLSAGIEEALQGCIAYRAIQGMPPIEPMEHVAPNEIIKKKYKKKAEKGGQ